jgi:multidrug efflux pump subunit AcrA (membrane-fusion protein)
LKLRTAAALLGGAAILSAAGAVYYWRIWPAQLLFPAVQSAETTLTPAGVRPGTPVPVKVAAVLVEDVPIYLSGIGTVQAYNNVNVQSRIDGEVIEIHFQEGQDVKQGDVLAVIDPKPLQAQLEQQIAIRQKDQALLDGAVLDLVTRRRTEYRRRDLTTDSNQCGIRSAVEMEVLARHEARQIATKERAGRAEFPGIAEPSRGDRFDLTRALLHRKYSRAPSRPSPSGAGDRCRTARAADC